jgi:putative oxidoreductase
MNERNSTFLSIGLLFLRLAVGSMMLLSHGWGKLIHFGEKAGVFPDPVFPDPIGLGSQISLSLTIFAEVFCSIAIILGLATRLVAIPLIITMSVAVFIIHADDPWQKKEFALLYLVPYLTLVFTGAGRFSLDAVIKKRKKD